MTKKHICLSIAATLLLASCIKDAAKNQECDIRRAVVHLPQPQNYFYQLSDTVAHVNPDYADEMIQFVNVKQGADLTRITPTFTISAGAILYPQQGTLRDFSNNRSQTYYVIAEDEADLVSQPQNTADSAAYVAKLESSIAAGRHVRRYNVMFSVEEADKRQVIDYTFDHYALESAAGKFYVWSDPDQYGNKRYVSNWSTANEGFGVARSSALPNEYPTVAMPSGGVDGGPYALLQTVSTGAWGERTKKPLASGNMYLGTFDFSVALTQTLRATRFGDNSTLGRKPLTLSGYYKYTAGAQITDVNGTKLEGRDMPAIYCVVYRNHDAQGNAVVLYGDNIGSSPLVVARAEMAASDWKYNTADWQHFELSFNWTEAFDPQLLAKRGYNYAIVCSASKDGDLYQGAIGSKLLIDNFRMTFE